MLQYPELGSLAVRSETSRGSRPIAMNLVFVCTSNTCRSPVAEQFAVEWFKRRLNLTREQQEEKGIRIRSAAYV